MVVWVRLGVRLGGVVAGEVRWGGSMVRLGVRLFFFVFFGGVRLGCGVVLCCVGVWLGV